MLHARALALVLAAASAASAAGTAPHENAETSLAANSYWETLAHLDRLAASGLAAERADALRRAAELRVELGYFADARRDAEAALTLAPGDPELLYVLASSERENPEEGSKLADAAAASPRANAAQRARANLLAAGLLRDLGDDAGAAKRLEAALKDAPGDLDALFLLARLTKSRDAAERARREAQRQPEWRRGSAYRVAARALLEAGDADAAAESLARALRRDPEDIAALGLAFRVRASLSPKSRAALARADAAKGPRGEPAAPALDEAAALAAAKADPRDLEALRRLAELAGRGAAAADRVRAFAAAVRRAPLWQRADAEREAARLWLALGKPAEAAAILEPAFDLQSDSLQSLQILYGIPGYERTTEAYSSAATIYCNAAELRLALGDGDGALESVNRALKLQPDHGWALRLKESLRKNKG